MKKLFISILLTTFSMSTYSAPNLCKSRLESRLENYYHPKLVTEAVIEPYIDGSGAGAVAIGAGVFGSLAIASNSTLVSGTAAVVGVGVGIVVAPIVIALGVDKGIKTVQKSNIRGMIKLIDQAEEFAQGNRPAGNKLRRLYRKVSRFDSFITMTQLADFVVKASNTGELCENIYRIGKLSKIIKNGSLDLYYTDL